MRQQETSDIFGGERRAFETFLRTGLRIIQPPPIEVKFNPYHDPRDGRFTFAPGGAANASGARSSSAASGHAANGAERAKAAPKSTKPVTWGGGGFTGGGGGLSGGAGASGDGYWLNPREVAEFQRRHPGMTPQMVGPGDTLAAVARAHGLSVSRLAAVNRIAVDAKLRPGAIVAIPAKQAAPPAKPATVPHRDVRAQAPTAIKPAKSVEHREPAHNTEPVPYHHIVKSGYDYAIDEAGRTREVEGTLTSNPDQGRSRLSQARAGGEYRRPDDQGGHYIGRQFNGPTDAFNHFAQNGNFNKSAYAKLENTWARSMKGGHKVRVHIDSFYSYESKRPDVIKVRYEIDGRDYERTFPNRAGTNHGR